MKDESYYVFVKDDYGSWEQLSIAMTLSGAESYISSKRYGNRNDDIYCIMQRLLF